VKISFRHFFAGIGLGLLLIFGAFGSFPKVAFAADAVTENLTTVGETTGLGSEDPKIIVGNIIRYALGFIGIVLVCFVVYGGFLWMTAEGNPEKVDKAKQVLINAAIGLVIILLSWSIATFVLSALTGASGGGSGGSGAGGGSGSGSGLGGSASSLFEITSFSPDGETSIRNIVPRVTFSKAIDETTVDGNLSIVDASGTAVAGDYAVLDNVIRFTPSTACPEPNADRFCFDKDATFTIAATENIKSSDGVILTCSFDAPCSATFTSGVNVDTEDPSASITIPESGAGVASASSMDVQVSAIDNVVVVSADFSIEDVWQDSVPALGHLAETTIGTTLSTESFVDGERYSISATVFDLAGNEDTDTVSVRAQPEWCFNGVTDADLGETGTDCGGDSSLSTYCGACDGSSCTEATECSSGSCEESVCTSNPTITDVAPISGAVGTFVTISGTDFGANTGTVMFYDAAGTGTVEATVLNDCADGWSDTQIVVEVPEGAGDGPILITSGNDVSDATDDDNGALVSNFDVNDVVMPNLCTLSRSSGQSESALTLSGSNFGESQGESVVNFSSVEAGSYTSWADGTVKVTIPNADAGDYDVAVVVGGNTSNTISFTVDVPETDVSTITDISPSSGGVGQYVTISGTNFRSSVGTVTFRGGDGTTATASIDFPEACLSDFWNDDQVTVIVPKSYDSGQDIAPGAYTVSVTNSQGTESTSIDFTISTDSPTPGICAITASGNVGESITIAGDNFGSDIDLVSFYSGVTTASSTRWTNDAIDVPVPVGATTGPLSIIVDGVSSNAVNFSVGSAESAVTTAGVYASYAWSFSTGEIAEVPQIVSECSSDIVSAVPSNEFSESGEICVNAAVYAEFTALMNEASVADAVTVAKCTATVSSSTDNSCATTEAVSGIATVSSSESATRFMWVPTENFDVNTTYQVTVSTVAQSIDSTPLASDETWTFTTAATDEDCVVDRVTVTPVSETLSEDGATTGFGANAGTGCVVVDNDDYAWDWSIDSYSYVDFNSSIDNECAGDPTACATFEAFAEGVTTVTATAINSESGGAISDDSQLTVNFTDPYISDFWPDCTESCSNAQVGALFNTTMTEGDIISGGNILLYSCANELCTTLTQVSSNPSCSYSDAAGTLCNGFTFESQVLTVGTYYRVIVSGSVRSVSGVALTRTNYGTGYSWTFRVREDGTLCSVERIDLAPSIATATAIGETAAFSVDAFGAADACSTSGQRLVGSDYAWSWEDPILDDAQNTETTASTAAWYTQSGELLDGSITGITEGCSASCTPGGSSAYQAVCGDGVLDQDSNGGGEECDDGNTTDHDGCSSMCLYEGSTACSFVCSSSGASCTADSECIETCDTSTSLCTLSGSACVTNSDCLYAESSCGTSGSNCCGNRDIEVNYSSDIAEDCDDGNLVDGDGCSSMCLAEGSAAVEATCGNNDVAYNTTTRAGEECDDGNNASGDGCSRQCLREGSQSLAALGNALCGDGVITTPYETCDDGNIENDDGCSSICIREGLSACSSSSDVDCCGNNSVDLISDSGIGEDCDGDEGCSDSCTFIGSSVSYSDPSVCGDGVSGLGEYSECESSSSSGDGRQDSVQVAQITDDAAGEVSLETNTAIANISVTEPSSSLTATALWMLSCTAESDQDCTDSTLNGVGTSNCCVPRPKVVSMAPTGDDVCRNSAITAVFDREMDTDSFIKTTVEDDETTKTYQMYAELILAEGQECPDSYTTSSYLAMNWFERVVATVKVFFFGANARAAESTDCVVPVTSFAQTAVGNGTYKVTMETDVALEEESTYSLIIVGDNATDDDVSLGVTSKLGVALGTSTLMTFKTGNDICAVDRVSIVDTLEDSPYVFTEGDESHDFIASAISYHGDTSQEIVGIADVYDWDWSGWSSSETTIVTVAADGEVLDSAAVTAAGKNGDAVVSATVTITADSEGGTVGDVITGTSDVTAFLCENTWPDLASFPWSDDETGFANGFARSGASGYLNFSTSYCQDYGDSDIATDDLPDVTVVLAPSLPSSDVLKEYLFEVDSSSTSSGVDSAGDAIGVRVLKNPDHLSPLAWYESKGFTGSPTETTIDNFQAITDERSTYVAAANSTLRRLYSNIVVISYNEGASDETKNIYEQMIANAGFLTNVADSAERLEIAHDTQRLSDLKDIASAVDVYGEESRTCSSTVTQTCAEDADCPDDETCEAIVPALSSGTAVRALASSAWGSWTSTFGGALNGDTLPVDPLNTYAECSGYDSATCVNQATGAYSCPVGSHVYHYRSVGTRAYELATDLEYTTLPWADPIESDSTDNVTFYTSSYCDGDVYGISSSCGDGIIGINSDGTTEVCEVGDINADPCRTADDISGTVNASCDSDCLGYTAASDAVCNTGTCGNGVVDIDLGELCDDGEFNGKYGYCGALCTFDGAEYCGDGLVSGGEACDCGDSTTYTAGRAYGGAFGACIGGNGTYSTSENATCAWDCRGPASYCGDSVVDVGESCDGNTSPYPGKICADGMIACFSDENCEGHGETCGSSFYGECPTEGYICSGGTKDGYLCASSLWDPTLNLVASLLCESAGGACITSGLTYETAHIRTCDSEDAGAMCGWESWSYCKTDGESCGNGVVDGSEECDDGNDVATDGCTTECAVNVCGDAYIYDGVEDCDEGTGNGGGCSSAYGSTCTACSVDCSYTTSSGEFCGDGVANGDEYCDGSDTPYVWYDSVTDTTNGVCNTLDSLSGDYTCRAVGLCNGGDQNGEYCTASMVIGTPSTDSAYCRLFPTGSGSCVLPVCASSCASTCPVSQSTSTLLLTSNQPGASSENDVDLYSFSTESTASIPNAATIEIPACTVAGNLVADVDFENVDRPDVYVVFVTDTSGSMSSAISGSSETRLAVAQESINTAIGTLFDELGDKMHIGLVHYATDAFTDTSSFLDQDSESILNDYVREYSAENNTDTGAGLDAARDLLATETDAVNVAKIIILLSDGSPNIEADADSAALHILKTEGIELYSLALTTTESLLEDMNRWSSNTICNPLVRVIGMCSTGSYNEENLIDYAYHGSSSEDLSAAYEGIVTSILDGTAVLLSSSDGDVVLDSGAVGDSRNISLPWPSGFACDGVNETSVPIQVNFRGEGTINVSNVRIEYCAP
jgi:cysteine-rich repeat protein